MAAALDELDGGYDDELALVLDVLPETARRLRETTAALAGGEPGGPGGDHPRNPTPSAGAR